MFAGNGASPDLGSGLGHAYDANRSRLRTAVAGTLPGLPLENNGTIAIDFWNGQQVTYV